MSFEHPSSGLPPEKPVETTLTLPAIPQTGPVPGHPELGSHTTSSAILPSEILTRINEPDTREYGEVPPFLSRPVKAAGLLLATLTVAGTGLAIGAGLNDSPRTSSAEAPEAPGLPAPATSLQSETVSPSAPKTTSPSKSVQTSPSVSISPSALPSTSKTTPVTIVSPTRKSTTAPTPTKAKPTLAQTAQSCRWPMNAQGDSEVRDTCASGKAMVAYNGPSNNSGESFTIYRGLYVHDESQSGAYTKVSIGSGANKTYGFILSDLIGNPFS